MMYSSFGFEYPASRNTGNEEEVLREVEALIRKVKERRLGDIDENESEDDYENQSRFESEERSIFELGRDICSEGIDSRYTAKRDKEFVDYLLQLKKKLISDIKMKNVPLAQDKENCLPNNLSAYSKKRKNSSANRQPSDSIKETPRLNLQIQSMNSSTYSSSKKIKIESALTCSKMSIKGDSANRYHTSLIALLKPLNCSISEGENKIDILELVIRMSYKLIQKFNSNLNCSEFKIKLDKCRRLLEEAHHLDDPSDQIEYVAGLIKILVRGIENEIKRTKEMSTRCNSSKTIITNVKSREECEYRSICLNNLSSPATVIKLLDLENLIVGFDSGEIGVFNLSSGDLLYSYNEHNSPISSLETASIKKLPFFNDDARFKKQVIISGSMGSDILVWDHAENHGIHRIDGHSGPISSLLEVGDGYTFISASVDRSVAFWDISASPSCIQVIEDMPSQILSMDYSHCDKILAVGLSSGEVMTFSLIFKHGKYYALQKLQEVYLQSPIHELTRSFSQPSGLLTLENGCIKVYSIERQKKICEIGKPQEFIDFSVIEWAEDNAAIVAIARSGELLMFNTKGEQKRQIGQWGLEYGHLQTGRPRTQILVDGNKIELIGLGDSGRKIFLRELNIQDIIPK